MTDQWQELKETITEMRNNDGTGTQQEVCKFLVNYMDILEKQMQEPCKNTIDRQAVLDMMQMRVSGKELYKAVYDLPPVNPQKCDKCEVANPCLYCRHEFEPQESEDKE